MTNKGFTLIELIMVLVILGIISVVAAPRMFNRSDFEARTFNDEIIAALRYGQKSAVAQRRRVCATFTANSVSLSITSTAPSGACDTPLRSPYAQNQYGVTGKNNTVFTATPSSFDFLPTGQASIGQTLQVSGYNNSIIIVSDTGYVYAP